MKKPNSKHKVLPGCRDAVLGDCLAVSSSSSSCTPTSDCEFPSTDCSSDDESDAFPRITMGEKELNPLLFHQGSEHTVEVATL